jgi:hypothetical protein
LAAVPDTVQFHSARSLRRENDSKRHSVVREIIFSVCPSALTHKGDVAWIASKQ